MGYKIYYKIWGDFLKVELQGEYPLEKFKEVDADIDRVVDSNDIKRLLVDLRKFKGRFGVFDGLNHIEDFRQESKLLQFAILDLPENKSNNDFFENASFNRGYKIMFFYDIKEALKWLQITNDTKPEKELVSEF